MKEFKKEISGELLFEVNVSCTDAWAVEGKKLKVVMVPFTGTASGKYFNGKVIGSGCDTQKYPKGGNGTLSARYMLEGTDCTGAKCRVFIENSQYDGEFWHPQFVTDSKELSKFEDMALRATVTGVEGGVVVRVYNSDNPEDKVFVSDTNPICKTIYTADPAPMVDGDTLYLYTTHDEDNLINDFYTMKDWRCYSTKDMVNWTDHGKIFSLEDIPWATDRAWAPQCCKRNGKYYLYCPVQKDNSMVIAAAVADKPEGPFKDIGQPLIDEGDGDWNDIDPTVFIDDDGQAYLYFGNPELRYVLLNEDMVSYNKEVGIQKIPMTVESFGEGSHFTGTSYGEGPWFYKKNGLYYMVFAGFLGVKGEKHNEYLGYSTSKTPTGPWTYGGILMDEGPCFTNHPGIADFKGKSYLFYHTDELPGGSLFHRSVCVAEMK